MTASAGRAIAFGIPSAFTPYFVEARDLNNLFFVPFSAILACRPGSRGMTKCAGLGVTRHPRIILGMRYQTWQEAGVTG